MADTKVPGGADRLDPSKNFQFIVNCGDKPVADIGHRAEPGEPSFWLSSSRKPRRR